MPEPWKMDDRVPGLISRIEQEITRHKAAHESHLHWAVIVFAAATAMFLRQDPPKDFWSIAACGFLVNLALWCRTARAYKGLRNHWDARDKVYSLLTNNQALSYETCFSDIEGLLDGSKNRSWTATDTLRIFMRAGVPEFALLGAVYLWFALQGVSDLSNFTISMLVVGVLWVLLFGLFWPTLKLSLLSKE